MVQAQIPKHDELMSLAYQRQLSAQQVAEMEAASKSVQKEENLQPSNAEPTTIMDSLHAAHNLEASGVVAAQDSLHEPNTSAAEGVGHHAQGQPDSAQHASHEPSVQEAQISDAEPLASHSHIAQDPGDQFGAHQVQHGYREVDGIEHYTQNHGTIPYEASHGTTA